MFACKVNTREEENTIIPGDGFGRVDDDVSFTLHVVFFFFYFFFFLSLLSTPLSFVLTLQVQKCLRPLAILGRIL